MHLHEFQAKELIARFGIAIPKGRIAGSAGEAIRIAARQSLPRVVVKAQVRSNNRMAAGGIVFCSDSAAVGQAAGQMLAGATITGERVRWVYIEEFVPPVVEIYAAVVADLAKGCLTLLASKRGGNDVERSLAEAPDLLIERRILLSKPNPPDLYLAVARALDLSGRRLDLVADALARMVTTALRVDASLVEINPLAITADERVVALDAKMTIDDHALFRHPELLRLRDIEALETSDPLAAGADLHQINYLEMDGEVGVVVNGAGLALATLDLLVDLGGRPANFMDIRTTATSQDIAYGFRLIAAHPRTRAVLVNVHGGGMQRCDTIAEGIAIAMGRSDRRLPLITRFAGNNAAFASQRLKAAGVQFEEARDIRHAAELVVARSGRGAG
jgi:succinyl-CoA synthetase beta subunit